MNIRHVHFEPNVVLAPMAGVTSAPFRLLCRRYGAGMSWSELVSASALVMGGERSQKKSHDLSWFSEEERPVALQIFGSEPEIVREAAAMMAESRPDTIDINMGCSVPKIAKCGAGCVLMKNPRAAEAVVAAAVQGAEAFNVPVTLKIRAGWDEDNITAPEVARRAEGAGAAAISVHPRTATQAFTGLSDWTVIRMVKEAVDIPVIGCGDVKNGADARRMLDETNCDAVMVGRAAQGNPFIFASIARYLKDGTEAQEPTAREKVDTALWHGRELAALKGEHTAMNEMRRHSAWYTKGMPESNRLRDKLCRVSSLTELEDILAECLAVAEKYAEAGLACVTALA